MRAVAGGHALPIGLNTESLRVLMREPSWWAGGWCAKHDSDVMFFKQANRAIEPHELKMPVAWLHRAHANSASRTTLR